MLLDDCKNMVAVWGPVSGHGLSRLKEAGDLILVPEQRPSLLGLKAVVPLLKGAGLDLVYCTDNMLGILFYKGKIKQGLVFYKQRQPGEVIASSGSLYFSLLSRLHNVPLEFIRQDELGFLAPDKDASSLEGENFILEENTQEYIIEPCEESIEEEEKI